METFRQDLRYAVRMLRRNPAYTAIIVLVLALGIGANALIFSAINVVLLMRFPYAQAERLVLVQSVNLKGTPGGVAPANFVDWRREARSFEYLSAKIDWSGYDMTGPEGPQQIIGVPVTAGIFEVLGVKPLLGRTFGPADDNPGSPRVAILSDRLWSTRYNRDKGVIGRTIMLNANPHTVIGVMPPGFYLNREVTVPANVDQLWVPLASQFGSEGLAKRHTTNYRVWGRLKPGVTREQAQAEMTVINARLQQAYPDTNAGRGIAVSPLAEFRADRVKRSGDMLMLLMGAVSFVLLIACANVANMQLARAAAQQRDLAIRTALGASRFRIIRQLMTEVLLLAMLGGAGSLFVAWWAQQLLMTFLPENLPVPRLDLLTIDMPVILFALGAALVSGIVAGVVPALQISSRKGGGATNEVLKTAGRGLTGDVRGRRLRNALVISEVGLAVILLVGAGLLIRSLVQLQQTSPGFDPANVLTVRIPAPDRPPDFTPEQHGKQRDLVVTAMLQRMQGIPGVESAGLVNGLPTSGVIYPYAIILERDLAAQASAIGRVVSPDYFRVMRIPLKAGRLLGPGDTDSTPRVVVIDETLAARYFPNADPIGQRLRWQGPEKSNPFATIVGVVGAVRDTSIRDEFSPEIYASYLQVGSYSIQTTLVIRGPQAAALVTPVRSGIAAVSPNQPIPQLQLMEQVVRSSVAAERFNARLLTGLAALALILAAAGIYGVISYSVARRAHEIGVRMALGAGRWQVLRLVLRQGLLIALIGIAAGAVGALFLTRLLTGLLHDVSPTDPLTFAAVALLLVGVALVACYVPARRAIRVDPVKTLRQE